jgi:hypothetical protein
MPDRFLDLTEGVAMLVTDLHGDRDAFNRYVRRFHALRESGEAQRLILMGDLIHGYGSEQTDGSLSMVLSVIRLQEEWGPDTVTMLLGNHEMPHIYGVSLMKGDLEFTPRFEHILGDHRASVLAFFERLPFYVRTAAGVILTHAGPAPDVIEHVDLLEHLDHAEILHEADHVLSQADDLMTLYRQYGALYGAPYADDAAYYLAIRGPDDPRFPHLLRAFMISQQSMPFKILWEALFATNEIGMTEWAYLQSCRHFLSAFSAGAPAEQRVIVSGHIVTPLGGYMLVNRCHFRLSSATHARPREAGCYLLFDCAKPVYAANELLAGVGSVFEDEED